MTLTSRVGFLDFCEEAPRDRGPEEWGCKIKEAVVDEKQREVWVVGEMKESSEADAGVVVETVEMLSFDENGRVFDIQDYQRKVRVGRGKED